MSRSDGLSEIALESNPATLELHVELGSTPREGQRYASVKAGKYTLYSDLVYDNKETPAEHNIMCLFSSRLRRLLEDE